MKSIQSLIRSTILAAFYVTTLNAMAADLGPKIDDFSDSTKNSLGIHRQFVDDRSTGGQTTVEHSIKDGVFSAKGDIVPPRGQPGWASTILLLDPQGLPQDASAYEGIRLRVRVNKGNIAISANSSEITNFDFHSAPIIRQADGQFIIRELPPEIRGNSSFSEVFLVPPYRILRICLTDIEIKKSTAPSRNAKDGNAEYDC